MGSPRQHGRLIIITQKQGLGNAFFVLLSKGEANFIAESVNDAIWRTV
jgi:hypothetical protein